MYEAKEVINQVHPQHAHSSSGVHSVTWPAIWRIWLCQSRQYCYL